MKEGVVVVKAAVTYSDKVVSKLLEEVRRRVLKMRYGRGRKVFRVPLES